MTARHNQRFVLARRPHGMPEPEDFRFEEIPLPELGEGEVLVQNRFLGIDPGMRTRLTGEASYAPMLEIDAVISAGSVGEVLESRNDRFSAGQNVIGTFGWQSLGISNGQDIRVVDTGDLPVSVALGVLGVPGLTAYFGLLDVGRPQPGETVLVSSAAGAVGSAVGQIARIKEARAVGIAGGAAKCEWLRNTLGFDEVIDRKLEPDLLAAIQRCCPDGVDVYFDNVGGEALNAAIEVMNTHGRVVICGQTAEYNVPPKERQGLRNTVPLVGQRIKVDGMLVLDYVKQFGEATPVLTIWINEGRLKYKEDITDGLENAPAAFIGLFESRNFGRPLIRIS